MGRVVFLNGDFIPEGEAKLSIFDRGLLFADAVYEGFGILDGQITDFAYHMDRLDSSLAKLNMPSPMGRDAMLAALMRLIAENQQNEGFLYLHITRGEGDRNYLYDDSYTPNIFAFTQTEKFTADAPPKPVSLASVPDIRWARRDIKTTNLLGQVMAKQAAHDAGAYEALMIDAESHRLHDGGVHIPHDACLHGRMGIHDLLDGVHGVRLARRYPVGGLGAVDGQRSRL